MKGLTGKVALVTGGTGLIGRSISQRLAAEGATVIVTSRQLKKAQQFVSEQPAELQAQFIPVAIDLSDEVSLQQTLNTIFQEGTIPTLLVANASLRDGLAVPFQELSYQNFSQLFEVDVVGHFLCARYLVDHLADDIPASFVFLSSIYAVSGVDHSIYTPGMLPTPVQYGAVKASVLGLTRYLAALWGKRQIRVNAVVAGGVRASERQTDQFAENFKRKTMLDRFARPHEIASAVAFLASDESSYMTGECLIVDGGFSAW